MTMDAAALLAEAHQISWRLTPNVPTILVASCITTEVHTRIRQDPRMTFYSNLTELLSVEASGITPPASRLPPW